jgi:multiple antibiotic resistance protein
MDRFWLAFLPMFVAMDPLGIVPIFLGLTADFDAAGRRAAVRQSVATALLVALGFLALGKVVFKALGVTMSDFLIAGGALLFAMALTDMLVAGKSRRRLEPGDETVGVTPLGVPLIVGPAVLATSLVLVDSVGPTLTVVSIAINVGLTGLALHWSERIVAVIGRPGTNAVSKLMALILAALGVMFIRKGLAGFPGLELPGVPR